MNHLGHNPDQPFPNLHSYHQPQTHTRPLPPLPAHLQSRLDSRPSSPDQAHTHGSSSTASTPNPHSPHHHSPLAHDDFGVGGPQKRDQRGRPTDRSGVGSRGPSPQVPVGEQYPSVTAGALAEAGASEEKPAKKRVKVGARAQIACATCRKRKVRCSADWPACVFCSTRALPCVYEGHPAENGGSLAGTSGGYGNYFSSGTIEPTLPAASIILEAIEPFFLHNYYTFYFLHRPTLTEQVQEGSAPKELILCILAFAARFSQSLRDLHPASPTAASEHYATLAAQVLANPPTNLPSSPSSSSTAPSPIPDSDASLIRCQCYLILGLFECTAGAENAGWLKIGTAIRMAQVLRLGFQDEDDGSRGRINPLQAEVRRRTFWACFLLDRTITDGKDRPTTLRPPLPSSLRMPGTDADFSIGRASPGARFEANLPPWNVSARLDSSRTHDQEADLYGQTLRISEIWHRVIAYIGAGGRNFDRRGPWLPESTFATLERDINAWSATLPAIFRYDANVGDANLIAHSMIGQGRLFGMLHLLYACSNLILHRDFLPFTPSSAFKASNGPIDGEPLYGSPIAPHGWWEDSLTIAFDSACVISDLCTALAQHGSQITHPFAGFAALAAGTLHTHLKYWPRSYRKPINANLYFEQDFGILSGLRSVYPIASHWCDGITRLDQLYSNLVRGVIDTDPRSVRASVIKLLRTSRDEEGHTSPARTPNGNGHVGPPLSMFQPANQFALEQLPSSTDMGGLGGEYTLEGVPLDDAFWGQSTWSDFSLFGLDSSGGGGPTGWT